MKTKILALLLLAAIALMLVPAMPQAVLAADTNVDINGMSSASSLTAAIADALQSAGSGGTVTVTGTATTDFTLDLNIPAGVTLVWKAALSSTYKARGSIYSGLLSVRGAGTLEVADGADLSMYSPSNGNITINVYRNPGPVYINITGGKIASYANNGYACHTIGSSESVIHLTVSGDATVMAASYGTGTANVIDLENSTGSIAVSGNARILATGENNANNVTAIAYTKGFAGGDISIAGGNIEVSSESGSATGINTPHGTVSISGGSISVKAEGGSRKSADAVRLGDNDLKRNRGSVGSVNISGGSIRVVNNSSTGNAFGIGVYNIDDSVSITGGTVEVTANGSRSGAYGIYYKQDDATDVRGNVTMTGGSITSTAAQHAYGIRLVDGFVAVYGGKVTASSTAMPPWAAYIEKKGVLAFLAGSYTGSLVLDSKKATGIVVEVDAVSIPAGRRGTNTGLTLKTSAGISAAGAVWDNTAASNSHPCIMGTGNGAGDLPKVQWGSYTGSAAASPTPAPTPGENGQIDSSDSVAAFVIRLYKNVLGREPDTAGLNSWVARLKTKEISGAAIAYEFFFSTEYMAKNTSNEEFVENLYQTMMGRPSDADGKKVWLERLARNWTREQVLQGFADSDEWGKLCDLAGIRR